MILIYNRKFSFITFVLVHETGYVLLWVPAGLYYSVITINNIVKGFITTFIIELLCNVSSIFNGYNHKQ